MKKLLAVLIAATLISSCAFAQSKIWYRPLMGKGVPTINPVSGVNTQYMYIDTAGNGNVLYVWKNSAWVRTGTTFAGSGGSARGIASAAINGSGQLVLTYTDATTQNLGVVVGATGATGATGPQGEPGPAGSGGTVMLNSMLNLLNYNTFTNMVMVKSFHNGLYEGTSIWFADNVVSNVDYVNHFRSKFNTSYCWHRMKTKPCLDAADFGAANSNDDKTLGNLGYTNTDISYLYDPAYGFTTATYADDAAFATVLKAGAKGSYMCVSNTPLTANIHTTIDVAPKNLAPEYANGGNMIYDNNGGHVTITGNGTQVMRRTVPTFSAGEDDNALAGLSYHIRNWIADGTPGASQSLFEIHSSYHMNVAFNKMRNVDYAFAYRHCMNSITMQNNFTGGIKPIQLTSQAGLVTGADQNNSGSNMSWFQSNRFFTTSSTLAAMTIDRSSSPVVNNTIIEGNNASQPLNGIVYDIGTSTVCKDFYVNVMHSEIGTSGSMIKSNAPFVNINGLWNQYAQTLYEQFGTGYPVIRLTNTPWKFGGVKFKASAEENTFIFDNTNAQDGDLTDASWWVGTRPRIFDVRYDQFINFKTFGTSGAARVRINNNNILTE